MDLLRYRFDCTKVPASDIEQAKQLLDWESETGISENYQKEPRIYYGMLKADFDVQKWLNKMPSLRMCTFREEPC